MDELDTIYDKISLAKANGLSNGYTDEFHDSIRLQYWLLSFESLFLNAYQHEC